MCNDEFGADEPHEYEQTEACGTSPCPNLSNDNDGVGAGCLSDMHYLSPSIKCFEHSQAGVGNLGSDSQILTLIVKFQNESQIQI